MTGLSYRWKLWGFGIGLLTLSGCSTLSVTPAQREAIAPSPQVAPRPAVLSAPSSPPTSSPSSSPGIAQGIPTPSTGPTSEKRGEPDRLLDKVLPYYRKGLTELERNNLSTAEKDLGTALSLLQSAGQDASASSLSGPSGEKRRAIEVEVSSLLAQIQVKKALPPPTTDDRTDQEETPDSLSLPVEPPLVSPDDIPTVEQAEKTPPTVPTPKAAQYDVPMEFNDQVKAYIKIFQTRKWGVVTRSFQRAGRYLPMIRQIFKENGLPQDLVYLAHIESAFNTHAYSRAQASGIWQFIEPTGRLYGMENNNWVDERRDPEKATRAAASHLKNLHEMFNSWPLALAAYNAGENKIQRYVRTQRTTDFWTLRRLPRETRLYVPAFMAMTIIAKDPERYGFIPPVEEPWTFDRVILTHPADLTVASWAAGTTLDVIRDLNPELKRSVTPPHLSRYEIRIPAETQEHFLARMAELTPEQWFPWKRHTVGTGETLASIAKRYKVSPATLREVNGLPGRRNPRANTVLLVPLPSRQIVTLPAPPQPSPPTGTATRIYEVRRGDTLWEIAQNFGVSLADLKRWNNLQNGETLQVGETLHLTAPPEIPGLETSASTSPSVSSTTVTYVVRRGDTLWEIAQNFGVSLADLKRWNNLTTPKIVPGLRLTIPPRS